MNESPNFWDGGGCLTYTRDDSCFIVIAQRKNSQNLCEKVLRINAKKFSEFIRPSLTVRVTSCRIIAHGFSKLSNVEPG